MNQEVNLREFEKLDWSHKFLHWLRVELKKIIAVIVLAIVLVVGSFLFLHYTEKKKELAAELIYNALQEQNWDNKINQLAEVEKRFSGLNISEIASFYEAQGLMKSEKFSDAMVKLNTIANSNISPILRVAALFLVAEINLKEGNLPQALSAYETASSIKGNLLKDESVYQKAKVLELMGERDKAKLIYEGLVNNLPEDKLGLKKRSEERLIWLATQG